MAVKLSSCITWLGTMSRNVPAVSKYPPLRSHGLGIRDLHMVDIPPVPDGLEDSVVEAEDHYVLHRLFAQIVIDAIDLVFLQHNLDIAVQRLSRVQIVSKRLFDYYSAPASILLPRKRGCAQLLHNLRKKFGCGRQIKEIVTLCMLRGVEDGEI